MLAANKHNNTVPVYQALNQPGKVTNQTQRPDLVYARLTTIDLLIRQLKKEGIGIIFSQHCSTLDIGRGLQRNEVVSLDYDQLDTSVRRLATGTRLIVISLKAGTTIRVSDIEWLARSIPRSHSLKWISILQQHSAAQLFKWELKYKDN